MPEVRAMAEKAIVQGLLGGVFGENGGVRPSGAKRAKNRGVGDLLVKECLKVWGKGAQLVDHQHITLLILLFLGPKNVKKTSLGLILTTLQTSLDSVSAASSGALGNVLAVVEGVIGVLGANSEVGGMFPLYLYPSEFLIMIWVCVGPTPAVTLAPQLLDAVGTLRGAKGFIWRERADGVIGAVSLSYWSKVALCWRRGVGCHSTLHMLIHSIFDCWSRLSVQWDPLHF